jgi:hypothetical protein
VKLLQNIFKNKFYRRRAESYVKNEKASYWGIELSLRCVILSYRRREELNLSGVKGGGSSKEKSRPRLLDKKNSLPGSANRPVMGDDRKIIRPVLKRPLPKKVKRPFFFFCAKF